MKKTFCDLCGLLCEDEAKAQEYFPYGDEFNGVDRDIDSLRGDLCDKCKLKMYRGFLRKFFKEHPEEKKFSANGIAFAPCKGYIYQLRKDNKIGWYEFGLWVKEKYGKKLERR